MNRRLLNATLAWTFILLAACPFTAPFATCDLAGTISPGEYGLIADMPQPASATTIAAPRNDSRRSRVDEQQFKDDEDQFKDEHINDIEAPVPSATECVVSGAASDRPALRLLSPPRFAPIALRI